MCHWSSECRRSNHTQNMYLLYIIKRERKIKRFEKPLLSPLLHECILAYFRAPEIANIKGQKMKSLTRRLGNVRSHIRFRPRSSTILRFWHNCLPNEEQIEKLKNSNIFLKLYCMTEKIVSKANNSEE